MELNLTKPLIIFDLETTGLNMTKDRIMQISMIKVMPSGEETELTELINPQKIIPADIEELTGITNADVVGKPTFKDLANKLLDFIADSDLAGFNSNRFDVAVLVDEFLRAGLELPMTGRRLIDARGIMTYMEPGTLSSVYKKYCHKEIENAHTASADARATYEVLKAQLDYYKDRPEISNDMDTLAKLSNQFHYADYAGNLIYNDKLEICFNFGKHKGRSVEEVFKQEPSYYAWMQKSDFSLSTKRIVQNIYESISLKR